MDVSCSYFSLKGGRPMWWMTRGSGVAKWWRHWTRDREFADWSVSPRVKRLFLQQLWQRLSPKCRTRQSQQTLLHSKTSNCYQSHPIVSRDNHFFPVVTVFRDDYSRAGVVGHNRRYSTARPVTIMKVTPLFPETTGFFPVVTVAETVTQEQDSSTTTDDAPQLGQ